MISSKQQLLDQLLSVYQDFRSAVDDLDERTFERKWLDNRWGVREIAEHIAGWHGKLGAGLERMQRGEPPQTPGEDWSDVQHWNDIFAGHAKGKRKAEVLDELDHAVRHFVNAATTLPDERLAEGKTARRMLDLAGIEHFREHTAMIRNWRGTQVGAGR